MIDHVTEKGDARGIVRASLTAAVLVSLLLICAGCGTTGNVTRSSSGAKLSQNGISSGPLEGDEDDDDGPGEELGHESKDPDIDGDDDHIKRRGYYDHDDGAIRAYGHTASVGERRALAELAKRYYTAVAAANGAATCSMLTPEFAKSVVGDYGRGSVGPAYLRNAGTCAEVMTLLLEHIHAQVSAPIEVTRVRVQGNEGLVFIGAPSMPASYLEAQRTAGAWRVVGLLASPLP